MADRARGEQSTWWAASLWMLISRLRSNRLATAIVFDLDLIIHGRRRRRQVPDRPAPAHMVALCYKFGICPGWPSNSATWSAAQPDKEKIRYRTRPVATMTCATRQQARC